MRDALSVLALLVVYRAAFTAAAQRLSRPADREVRA